MWGLDNELNEFPSFPWAEAVPVPDGRAQLSMSIFSKGLCTPQTKENTILEVFCAWQSSVFYAQMLNPGLLKFEFRIIWCLQIISVHVKSENYFRLALIYMFLRGFFLISSFQQQLVP